MGAFGRRGARRTRWRVPAAVAGGAVALVACFVLCTLAQQQLGEQLESSHGELLLPSSATAAAHRRRLSGGGCDGGGFAAVPKFGVGKIARVAFSCLVTAWCFLGLAIVCDEFFQPSLEAISEALRLPPDVAGATFLAAGSSAPELFTSVGDSFGPASSIGVGTIMGSAMFNILIIVAASAMYAGTSKLKIDWRPVTRDVSFYTLSIVLFAACAADGEVNAFEAGVMLAGYGAYIAFMVANERIFARCAPRAKVYNSKEIARAANPAAALARIAVRSAQSAHEQRPRADSMELTIVPAAARSVADVGGGGSGGSSPVANRAAASNSAHFATDRRVSTGADYFHYDRNGFREFDTYKKGKHGNKGAKEGKGQQGQQGAFHMPARLKTHADQAAANPGAAAAAATGSPLAAAAAAAAAEADQRELSPSPWAAKQRQAGGSPSSYAQRVSSKPPAAFYHKGSGESPRASPTLASSAAGGASEVPEDDQPSPAPSPSTSPASAPAAQQNRTAAAVLLESVLQPEGGGMGSVLRPADPVHKAFTVELVMPSGGGGDGGGGGGEGGGGDDDDGGGDRLAYPSDGGFGEKLFFVLSLPFLLAFTVTIPDCENPAWEKWMWTAFFSSIIWIGAICHMMVQMASHIGCDLGISPITMGTLVLAVGTSVPDAIGSILAAKSGEADMAIANAIGSNIFDILLGMGLPWLLVNVAKGELVPVNIPPSELGLACGILLFTVFFFVSVLVRNKWCMTPAMGKQLAALYACFVVYTILQSWLKG